MKYEIRIDWGFGVEVWEGDDADELLDRWNGMTDKSGIVSALLNDIEEGCTIWMLK